MSDAASGGPADAVIAARGLTRRYGPVAALDALDLTVRRGEFVLLAGANGAGKSTLLRLCATLLRPTSGSLDLFGTPARGEARRPLRRRLGLLTHQTLLYDHLTGRENLLFYARLYGIAGAADAARDGLRGAGLEGRADDEVRTYSRGMQQRLAIARVFLHDPEMLLLDEPWSGLDRASGARLEARLLAARSAGRTCVLATHDLEAGLRLAHRVVVLAAGRVAGDRPAAGLEPGVLESLMRAPRAVAAGGA